MWSFLGGEGGTWECFAENLALHSAPHTPASTGNEKTGELGELGMRRKNKFVILLVVWCLQACLVLGIGKPIGFPRIQRIAPDFHLWFAHVVRWSAMALLSYLQLSANLTAACSSC